MWQLLVCPDAKIYQWLLKPATKLPVAEESPNCCSKIWLQSVEWRACLRVPWMNVTITKPNLSFNYLPRLQHRTNATCTSWRTAPRALEHIERTNEELDWSLGVPQQASSSKKSTTSTFRFSFTSRLVTLVTWFPESISFKDTITVTSFSWTSLQKSRTVLGSGCWVTMNRFGFLNPSTLTALMYEAASSSWGYLEMKSRKCGSAKSH